MRRSIGFALAAMLMAAGNLCAQGFQLLDNGTGSKQVIADGALTYVLKDNGNIWQLANGQWQMVDNGSGTPIIAASGGFLYAQKDDGSVWMRSSGRRSQIGTPGTRQMVPFSLSAKKKRPSAVTCLVPVPLSICCHWPLLRQMFPLSFSA